MSPGNVGNDRVWYQRLFDNPGLVIPGKPTAAFCLRDHLQSARRHVRLKRMVNSRHEPIPSKRSRTWQVPRPTRRWDQNDALDPTECLLDPLADALADSVATVPDCSPVDRIATTTGILRAVRSIERGSFAKYSAVGVVGAPSDRYRPGLNHVQRGHSFGISVNGVRQASTSKPSGFSISPCQMETLRQLASLG